MRLVTFAHDGQPMVGVLTDGGVIPTDYDDMTRLIEDGAAGLDAVRAAAEQGTPVQNAHLLAPILTPGKILCCGVNYLSHKEENPNATLPATPFIFSKLPSAVIGPEEAIVIPSPQSQVDYEVELAVVIGRRAKKVRKADALDYIFGYTILHDVSARDVQFVDQQITLGKGFDTFSPIGPCITLKDEIPDPQALRLATYLNGEQMQNGSTAEQLFDVKALIEFLTTNITLNPGDIVSTGTPAGVAAFRNPSPWLMPGDVVEVEVEGIGRLRNRVVAGW